MKIVAMKIIELSDYLFLANEMNKSNLIQQNYMSIAQREEI